jgi:hypothetical protein
MDIQESINKANEKDIIAQAQQTQYYCDQIIEQSDNWLPAEEGNRVMLERIRENERKKKGKKTLGDKEN